MTLYYHSCALGKLILFSVIDRQHSVTNLRVGSPLPQHFLLNFHKIMQLQSYTLQQNCSQMSKLVLDNYIDHAQPKKTGIYRVRTHG